MAYVKLNIVKIKSNFVFFIRIISNKILAKHDLWQLHMLKMNGKKQMISILCNYANTCNK